MVVEEHQRYAAHAVSNARAFDLDAVEEFGKLVRGPDVCHVYDFPRRARVARDPSHHDSPGREGILLVLDDAQFVARVQPVPQPPGGLVVKRPHGDGARQADHPVDGEHERVDLALAPDPLQARLDALGGLDAAQWRAAVQPGEYVDYRAGEVDGALPAAREFLDGLVGVFFDELLLETLVHLKSIELPLPKGIKTINISLSGNAPSVSKLTTINVVTVKVYVEYGDYKEDLDVITVPLQVTTTLISQALMEINHAEQKYTIALNLVNGLKAKNII